LRINLPACALIKNFCNKQIATLNQRLPANFAPGGDLRAREDGTAVSSVRLGSLQRATHIIPSKSGTIIHTRADGGQPRKVVPSWPRSDRAIERLYEEFKRRIKTQTVLPSGKTAAMLF
jgi:hypothetical protein